MSTSATVRDIRRQRRFEKLTSSDAQFIAAQPDPAISAGLDGPDVLLTDAIRIVMDGYADRPALGQRAVEFVTERTAAPSPVAAAVRHHHLPRSGPRSGCRRCTGRQSCPARRPRGHARLHQRRLRRHGHGAVADRRRHGAAADQCAGATAAPDPRRDRAGRDRLQRRPLADAVELALTGLTPKRLVVFDYHPQVDDQREALRVRRGTPGRPSTSPVETFADVIEQRRCALRRLRRSNAVTLTH